MNKFLNITFLFLIVLSANRLTAAAEYLIGLNREGQACMIVTLLQGDEQTYALPHENPEGPVIDLPLNSFYYSQLQDKFLVFFESGHGATITPALAAQLYNHKDGIAKDVQRLKKRAAKSATFKPFTGAIVPIAFNHNKPYVLLAPNRDGRYALIQTYHNLHQVSHKAMHKAFNSQTHNMYGIPKSERDKEHSPAQVKVFKQAALAYFEQMPKEKTYYSDEKRRIFPKVVKYISTKQVNRRSPLKTPHLQWVALSQIKALEKECEDHALIVSIGKRKLMIDSKTVADLNHPQFKQTLQEH